MAKYKLTDNGVHDTEDNIFIPNHEGNRHWQIYLTWVGLGNTADPMDVVPLDDVKTIAKGEVDGEAERTRLRYITNGAGQAMAYQEKSEEAADYIAAGYPADLTGYPFMQAEINATSKTKEVDADDIISQKAAWVAIGASIEEERLGGKKNIEDAVDESGVDSAKDSAITALEAL